MLKALGLAAAVILAVLSSPALAAKGTERSCAGMVAPIEGGGFVAFIIHSFGPHWWEEFWAQPTDCG